MVQVAFVAWPAVRGCETAGFGAAKAVAHVQGRRTLIVERLPASLASQAALERGQGGLAAQNDKIPPAVKTDDGNAHASLMKVL